MDTPTYNADGETVWKPQPGEYYPGGLRYALSYGGVVSAIQDLQASKDDPVKTYPNNFAGIIAALADLQVYLVEGFVPETSLPPAGWEPIQDPDGNWDGAWQKPPPDGALWFDKRQGRLFIAIEGEYYQTNGGDGLAAVGPEPPTTPPVVGSSWLDTDTGILYIYIGDGIWQAVVSDGDITITTATLPLAISRTTRTTGTYSPQILPELPSIEDMQVQKDYNTWLMEALVNLDKTITEGSVTIGEEPPTDNVVPGTLWYDARTLELSIYYQDDDSSQWVPVSTGFGLEEALEPLRSQIEAEVKQRQQAIDHLYSMISEMDNIDDAEIDALKEQVAALENTVNSLVIPDISGLATKAELTSAEDRIDLLEQATIDFSPYATVDNLQETEASLTELIDHKINDTFNDVLAIQPDISNKVEQEDIDASIAAITPNFLRVNGGTVDGQIIVNKTDINKPAFDVSSEWWNSQQLFKLKSNSPNNSVATFGSTEQFWQYAWDFAGEEDFAWVHADAGKVFSISKDGPACTQLHIGTFGTNTADGRVINNKIEVGESLRKYKQAFTDIRVAVNGSADFDSLKANLLQALSGL